jgi:hypothetical protein
MLRQLRKRRGRRDTSQPRVQSQPVSFFKTRRSTEITAVSGAVRVTVHPQPAWLLLLLEVVIFTGFATVAFRGWAHEPIHMRALLVIVTASCVLSFFYQLSGTEVIEIDARKISLEKDLLGWQHIREYPTSKCTEFEVRYHMGRNDYHRLQFKLGWRTIRFGEYMSEEEGDEVVNALYDKLPEVARQIGAMLGSPKNFTTLNLS